MARMLILVLVAISALSYSEVNGLQCLICSGKSCKQNVLNSDGSLAPGVLSQTCTGACVKVVKDIAAEGGTAYVRSCSDSELPGGSTKSCTTQRLTGPGIYNDRIQTCYYAGADHCNN